MKINVLTKGFLSPTSRGWLHPILKNKSRLFEMGLDLNFYQKYSERVKDCDIVIVESKFVRADWKENKLKIFEFLKDLKTKNNKVFYYDLGDNTYSWGLEALPYVDKLFKPFIFKDKNYYCIPLEGFNILTDFYCKEGIVESNIPLQHKTLPEKPYYIKNEDKHLLDKIHIGFNSVFADNGLDSNLWKYNYFSRLTRHFFKLYSMMLQNTKIEDFIRPSLNRKKDVSCRISLDGYSSGINFHRTLASKILKEYLSTNKLNRKEYFKEMRDSKIVFSPFGWGEINVPRDYEVALSGAILVKPDISHLDTWPNIFNKDTVVQCKWDLSNLLEILDNILSNYNSYLNYAINLQDQYKNYSFGKLGQEKFCEYFVNMLKN